MIVVSFTLLILHVGIVDNNVFFFSLMKTLKLYYKDMRELVKRTLNRLTMRLLCHI